MRYWAFLIGLSLFLVGCSDATPTSVVVVTATLPPICDEWQASDNTIICLATQNGQVAQSQGEQITLRAYDLSIVVSGTVLITSDTSLIGVQVLEGDAIVSARGQNQVLSIGQRITVSLEDGIAQFPSEIMPILNNPSNLPFDELPRAIELNAFVITPTPHPTNIPTPAPLACPIPADWTGIYEISSGDTLVGIANRYDLSLEDLADANCIDNVARIVVGEELSVPFDENNSTTLAPVAIGFRADAYVINAGECTVLRWDGFGAQAIYLDDTQVDESSFLEICLDETQSFTMRVIFDAERSESRELTISVLE